MQKLTTQQFLDRCQEIHGDQYNYSLAQYKNMRTKITIVCPVHGEFIQCPKDHLNQKQGCPLCGNKKKNLHRQPSTAEFIKTATEKHHNKYDYTKVCYHNSLTKITIICRSHGEFQQTAGNHLHGQGCPSCSCNISNTEEAWLTGLKIAELKRSPRIYLYDKNYYKPDGYDPATNTVYEFFGDFWHGNPDLFDPIKLHPIIKKTYKELYEQTMNKVNTYKQNGYNVIYIWENDFNSFVKASK